MNKLVVAAIAFWIVGNVLLALGLHVEMILAFLASAFCSMFGVIILVRTTRRQDRETQEALEQLARPPEKED